MYIVAPKRLTVFLWTAQKTVTTYKLYSADGEVFGWTDPLDHRKYLSANLHEETNYELTDGRIPRQIYKNIHNVVPSTVPTYIQGNMCI